MAIRRSSSVACKPCVGVDVLHEPAGVLITDMTIRLHLVDKVTHGLDEEDAPRAINVPPASWRRNGVGLAVGRCGRRRRLAKRQNVIQACLDDGSDRLST
jgi:hypothetical protein